MKKLLPLAAAAWLACAAQPAPKSATVAAAAAGPDAVWSPPATFRETFHGACDAAGQEISACFLREMATAGASPAAVAFARLTGGQGYLVRFRETGIVDVAYAEYPFRANENRVVFLVNGHPPMIDVDTEFDERALEGDNVFASLRRGTSNLTIFPGDRSDARFPRVLPRTDGGTEFVVPYELTDGCHACKVLADALIAFVFDANGRLLGTSVVRVSPRYH